MPFSCLPALGAWERSSSDKEHPAGFSALHASRKVSRLESARSFDRGKPRGSGQMATSGGDRKDKAKPSRFACEGARTVNKRTSEPWYVRPVLGLVGLGFLSL